MSLDECVEKDTKLELVDSLKALPKLVDFHLIWQDSEYQVQLEKEFDSYYCGNRYLTQLRSLTIDFRSTYKNKITPECRVTLFDSLSYLKELRSLTISHFRTDFKNQHITQIATILSGLKTLEEVTLEFEADNNDSEFEEMGRFDQ